MDNRVSRVILVSLVATLLSSCSAGMIEVDDGDSVPSALTVSRVENTRATVAWVEPAGVSSYEVRLSGGTSASDSISLASSTSTLCNDMTALADPPAPAGEGAEVQFRVPGLWPEQEYGVCVLYISDSQTSEPTLIAIDTAFKSVTYASTATQALGYTLAVGDVNDDGMPDVVVGNAIYDALPAELVVPVFFGRSELSSVPDVVIESTGSSALGTAVAIGDVDCDGVSDLIVGDPTWQRGTDHGLVSVFAGGSNLIGIIGQADATSTLLNYLVEQDNDFGIGLATGRRAYDETCDTMLIGAASFSSQRGALYIVEPPVPVGERRVDVEERYMTGAADDDSLGAVSATLGEFVGGSAMDAAVLSVRGSDPGDISEVTVFGTDLPAHDPFDIELLIGGPPVRIVNVGDLDGNGYDEMALSTPGMEGGHLDIYYGGESFVGMRHVSVDYTTGPFFAISVASGDIDGDGNLDLLVGGTEQIFIYAGPDPDPSGTPTVIVSAAATSLGVGDMNGDGYVDLATGDMLGGTAIVAPMIYTGAFSFLY
jgi:VCBS repeat protein/FG-GAP repeat protein